MYNEQENPGWRTPEDQPQDTNQPIWEEPKNEGPSPWEQPLQYPQPPKKKSGLSFGKVVAVALVCSLLGGALGAGSVLLFRLSGSQNITEKDPVTLLEGQREDTQIQLEQIPTGELMNATQVYAKNVNSTVGIKTSITTNYWGYQTTSAASGSGFVLSEDGYVLTNFHVVEDSNAITVSCYDGTTYDAILVGYDESNDIAVLKVEATGLTPVILGDSQKLNVGDDVIAIGNPLGELTFSLTAGKISSMDRQVTMQNGVTMDLIQTDCAINSGNSGGALFNMYGEVVGITNAKYSGNSRSGASIDNIAFAIPINDVRSIVESIIEKGYVAKPYIGVSVTDVSAETQSYGLPQGAAVQKVIKDSPAEAAGLQLNDIVTHINGQEITGRYDLISMVSNAQPGDTFKMTIYRRGQTMELELTVGEKVESALPDTTPAEQQPLNNYPWGFLP